MKIRMIMATTEGGLTLVGIVTYPAFACIGPTVSSSDDMGHGLR